MRLIKNIASVLVTATLPEFGRIGFKIDVKVSSIGDAKVLPEEPLSSLH